MREVFEHLPDFLERMTDRNQTGRFRYSLSGDLFASGWGLGNSVYAAKIFFMIGQEPKARSEMLAYIQSFAQPDGSYRDVWAQKTSLARRWYRAFRYWDFRNFFYEETLRAETRQSLAAIKMLGGRPRYPFSRLPRNKTQCRRYVHSLPWGVPWSAGSHFSHLIFFLHTNQQYFPELFPESRELIETAFQELQSYKRQDGSWYTTNCKLPVHQKINAAMKIFTALEVAGIKEVEKVEALIELCLEAKNDEHACNHFNVVYVLYRCSRLSDYRRADIENYFLDRLDKYKAHYFPQSGGFSFHKGHASKFYYAARVSRGLREPDIHGTHLFAWALVLIADFFNLNQSFNLRFPVT